MSASIVTAPLSATRSAFRGNARAMTAKKVVRAGSRSVVTRAEVKEIHMPALSSTMTEGKIVSWLKGEGDSISKGEAVVVVESDKADMDVETFYDGYLAYIAVEDGEMATVGAPIAYVAETEGEIDQAKAMAAAAGGGAAPAAAPAPAAPEPAPPAPPPPPPAPVAAAPAPAPAPAPAAAAPVAGRPDGRIIATPYAKKLAKKHKVDLKTLAGTGLNGRITAVDIENAAGLPPTPKAGAAPAPAAAAAAAPKKAAAVAPPAPAGTVVPLSGMQAAVAKNMLPSLSVPVSRIAMSICTDEFDKLYATLKPKGVTMTALLTKAVGVALAQHPIMYSTYHDGKGIVYNDKVNIAVAVALDDGLITPVLNDTANTDVYQLGREWSGLVKKARSTGLSPADYAGGNFTISNLGMFGVDQFDAILPPNQTAILAVGSSKKTVVPVGGMIGVKSFMTVNIVADHRHVNGNVAADFGKTLREVIENPSNLTL